MRIRPGWLAIGAGALAFIGFNAAYLISALGDQVRMCVPYLEGCSSISKAGRQTPAIYVYRATMIPSATLMAAYWWLAYRWLVAMDAGRPSSSKLVGFLGISASVSLILYAIFLDSNDDIYKLIKRFGAAIFFVFTGFGQLLFTARIFKVDTRSSISLPRNVLRAKAAVCAALLAFAVLNIVITYYDIGPMQNIIEWNVATLMALYFILTAPVWRATGFELNGVVIAGAP